MAFGIKIKTIATQREYTTEELYEAIKGRHFTAGEPSLVTQAGVPLIVFPALDRQNQVQIVRSGFSKSVKKWTVQKAEQAGLGNMAANMAIDHLTSGLFSFGKMVGGNAKKCEQLVEATFEELKAMNL